MTRPRMSAVVVAWNAGSTLAACVESLRESARRANEPLQTVVVDNGSSDGAVDELRLDADDVVVRNPLNAGYGVAAAQGIARSDAPWILLVNPDLTVERDFIGALLAAADIAEHAVATLVPEMRFASRPELVNCRGLTVDEIGVPAEIDAGTPALEEAAPSIPVLGGSSGCCLLRAEHVRGLGGPEPAFFAYLEDVDLALRLSCAGYEARFVPSAIAFHEGSASTGAQSPLKVFLVARNRRLLFRLHGPRSPRATAWRALTDVAHGAYSSLGTPIAPWTGRLEALRFRRYVRFLRRSRAESEPCVARYAGPSRATLRETLGRKRRIVGRDG
jgi:N-acetylglucosaminyl-diphospho-decaprenol L-rhamnosyltransferase